MNLYLCLIHVHRVRALNKSKYSKYCTFSFYIGLHITFNKSHSSCSAGEMEFLKYEMENVCILKQKITASTLETCGERSI